jgi:hypothetical protein
VEDCHSERGIVIPSEPKASRGISIFPAMTRLDRVFPKRTQMSLISQISQRDSAGRSEALCAISMICEICVRFLNSRDV